MSNEIRVWCELPEHLCRFIVFSAEAVESTAIGEF